MKPAFKWRHQYDTERDTEEGNRAAVTCEDPSLTQQQFTDDADINVIAKRFGLSEVPVTPFDPSHFRDTTNDPDLRTVLELQNQAREDFMALPAKLRRRFHDSPQELWDFVQDPENHEEAVRLGILAQAPIAGSAQSGTPTASDGIAHATNATNPTGMQSREVPPLPPESPRP